MRVVKFDCVHGVHTTQFVDGAARCDMQCVNDAMVHMGGFPWKWHTTNCEAAQYQKRKENQKVRTQPDTLTQTRPDLDQTQATPLPLSK